MGEVSHNIGITVARSYNEETVTIAQKGYAEHMFAMYGLYGQELHKEQPEESLRGASGFKLF